MSTSPVPAFVPGYAELVDAEMKAVLSSQEVALKPLYAILQYHLGWTDRSGQATNGPGKRLRPALCLLSCEAAGGDRHTAVPAAASVELLHNFSLIHDDIEDESPVRRGRETVWRIWGVPQAINAGDGLLILAYQTVHRLRQRGLGSAEVEEASAVLHQAGRALFEGQYLDLMSQDATTTTVAGYLVMAERKTAAVLRASCQLGAIAAGADEEVRSLFGEYGRELGLAYQATDDILGIWGDPSFTGKPVGEDLLRGKLTLPVVTGLEEERRRGQTALSELISRPPEEADPAATTKRLEELGAAVRSRELAEGFITAALDRLNDRRLDKAAVDRLGELSRYIASRET